MTFCKLALTEKFSEIFNAIFEGLPLEVAESHDMLHVLVDSVLVLLGHVLDQPQPLPEGVAIVNNNRFFGLNVSKYFVEIFSVTIWLLRILNFVLDLVQPEITDV